MNDSEVVKLQFKNSVTGVKKLDEYEKKLKTLKVALDNLPSGINISTEDVKNVDKTNKNLKDLSSNSKNVKNVLSAGKVVAIGKSIQNLVQQMSKFTSLSADYVENLNLMNVAYHRTEDSIDEVNLAGEKLVNTLSEMYGLDESNLTRMVGIFKQLSNAMGVSDELGNKLTKTLTQMSIDVSSLYNVSLERASSVLQSSLAGQTKPIRSLAGADITESTLQVTLEAYGIDRTVRDLSYVEKRLIIVTSLIDQLKESQNDYGKTINSVANQMRMFNEQTQRLSRAIGNVFLPILQKILPYINGVLMVLTEVINMFARLIGFDEDMLAGFAAGSDTVADFSESMDNANDSAKKLKQGLRGFDKLNVITTPSNTGAGVSGGLDADIIDAFNKASLEYEQNLEKIRTKASEIRDTIMEWLGFSKDTNGEWEFTRVTLGTIAGLIGVGGILFSGVKKTYGFVTGISNLLNPKKGLINKGLTDVNIKTTNWKATLQKGIIVGGLAVIATNIANIALQISRLQKDGQKVLDLTIEAKKEFMKTADVEQNLRDLEINRINAQRTLKEFGEESYETLEKQVKTSGDYLDTISKQLENEETSLDFKNHALQNLKEQFRWNNEIIGRLDEQGKSTEELVDINQRYKEELGLIASQINDSEDGWKKVLKQAGLTELAVLDIGLAMGKVSKLEYSIKWINTAKSKFTELKNDINKFFSKDKILGIKIDSSKVKFPDLKIDGLDVLAANIKGALEKVYPRKKNGMDFVPNDYYGPVYLDYGERVLTKEENQAYMRGNVSATQSISKTVVSPTIIVRVGDEELARTVLTNLQNMATSNGEVIEIGG